MDNQDSQPPPLVLEYRSPPKGPKASDTTFGVPSLWIWIFTSIGGLLAVAMVCISGTTGIALAAVVVLACAAGAHLGLAAAVAGLFHDGRKSAAIVGASLNGVYCLLFWMAVLGSAWR